MSLPDIASREVWLHARKELLAREKEQRLRSVGIRYLRFAPGAFPKPAEVRKLIYGE